MDVAEVAFVCNNHGGVRVNISRYADANEVAWENAAAIERLVRVAMRAQGARREAIESAVNAAEQAQKEEE